MKPRFSKKLTPEFLHVDQLDVLAEDRDEVLRHACNKWITFDLLRLRDSIHTYGNMATRKRFEEWIDA